MRRIKTADGEERRFGLDGSRFMTQQRPRGTQPGNPSKQRVRCCPIRRLLGDKAFTLIELLVVIAVIAVLISIMAPSLVRARMVAKQTREMNAARQLMVGFTCYAGDNKNSVLVGFPSEAMVSGSMVVTDDRGNRVFGPTAQRYPWRIASYFGTGFCALYDNQKLLADLRDAEGQYESMGVHYPYIVSLYPSLGMNIAFVGGSDKHGANDKNFQKLYGRQYVEKIDEPVRPSRMLTFVSARGDDQPTLPGIGRLDGFFYVAPPYWNVRKWAQAYKENPVSPETVEANSGNVSLRYGGKAVATAFDSHAEMLGWAELNDMTRWSNKATSADWVLAK